MHKDEQTGRWVRDDVFDDEADILTENAEKMESILIERQIANQKVQFQNFQATVFKEALKESNVENDAAYALLTPAKQAKINALYHKKMSEAYSKGAEIETGGNRPQVQGAQSREGAGLEGFIRSEPVPRGHSEKSQAIIDKASDKTDKGARLSEEDELSVLMAVLKDF